MAVQIFDVSDLISTSGLSTYLKDRIPSKIRVRFEKEVGNSKRRKTTQFLKSLGYNQIGNTTSWLLTSRLLRMD